MSKKNPLKRDLFTKKYKPRIIKPKKGKFYLFNFLKTVSGKFPLETLAVSSP